MAAPAKISRWEWNLEGGGPHVMTIPLTQFGMDIMCLYRVRTLISYIKNSIKVSKMHLL